MSGLLFDCETSKLFIVFIHNDRSVLSSDMLLVFVYELLKVCKMLCDSGDSQAVGGKQSFETTTVWNSLKSCTMGFPCSFSAARTKLEIDAQSICLSGYSSGLLFGAVAFVGLRAELGVTISPPLYGGAYLVLVLFRNLGSVSSG